MIQTNLTLQDFEKYFKDKKLGRLYFPNGECLTNGEITNFHINLRDLYKLVVDWEINKTKVPINDIIGIIAFGSAIKYPGYEIQTKTRNYIFFKKQITKQVPILPNDADFLVITKQDFLEGKTLAPVSLQTYDCGTWIKEGGIHIVNRGINQLINGIKANTDTISISAIKEGVIIFSSEQLNNILKQTGISNKTPRKIYWDENKHYYLVGEIR